MYKVTYNGFLQTVERFFPTLERAEQWIRQIGMQNNLTVKKEKKV